MRRARSVLVLIVLGYLLWPLLCDAAWWLVTRPAAPLLLVGALAGLLIGYGLGWNDALAQRRDQAIDRARAEYQKDKRL